MISLVILFAVYCAAKPRKPDVRILQECGNHTSDTTVSSSIGESVRMSCNGTKVNVSSNTFSCEDGPTRNIGPNERNKFLIKTVDHAQTLTITNLKSQDSGIYRICAQMSDLQHDCCFKLTLNEGNSEDMQQDQTTQWIRKEENLTGMMTDITTVTNGAKTTLTMTPVSINTDGCDNMTEGECGCTSNLIAIIVLCCVVVVLVVVLFVCTCIFYHDRQCGKEVGSNNFHTLTNIEAAGAVNVQSQHTSSFEDQHRDNEDVEIRSQDESCNDTVANQAFHSTQCSKDGNCKDDDDIVQDLEAGLDSSQLSKQPLRKNSTNACNVVNGEVQGSDEKVTHKSKDVEIETLEDDWEANQAFSNPRQCKDENSGNDGDIFELQENDLNSSALRKQPFMQNSSKASSPVNWEVQTREKPATCQPKDAEIQTLGEGWEENATYEDVNPKHSENNNDLSHGREAGLNLSQLSKEPLDQYRSNADNAINYEMQHRGRQVTSKFDNTEIQKVENVWEENVAYHSFDQTECEDEYAEIMT